ncbi:MAG: FeoB-associated Cys-rich membrane protein [Christensenellales bacterium]|jgi:hypothetical protein
MNFGTAAITLLLVGLVVWIVRGIRKDKREGKSPCGGNCGNCPMGGACQGHK